MPNNDLDTYLRKMSEDRTWGDHIILVALANALAKTIRVVTSHEGDCYEVVVEANNQQGAPILLGHLTENHYVSLEPVADQTTKAEGIPTDSNSPLWHMQFTSTRFRNHSCIATCIGYDHCKIQ